MYNTGTTSSNIIFHNKEKLVFGAAPDSTTTSSVGSNKLFMSASSSANNTFANATSNNIFPTGTFTLPTTTSCIGTIASVTTTSASIITTHTSEKNTTVSNKSSLFGRCGPTATINDAFGKSTSPCDSNQRMPVTGSNRLFPTNILEEAVEFKKVGQLGIVMSSYIWKISNFSDLCESSEKVMLCFSPVFKIGGVGQDEKRYKMYLYPWGTSTFCKEYVSINIKCQDNVNSEAQVSFSILDANLQIVNEAFPSVLPTKSDLNATKMGCNRFVKWDTLLDSKNGLLSNDTLTILCQISLKTSDVRPVFSPEMKINKDFGHLFESEKFSDLILEVEDKEFKVHKSVLAARSPKFHEMLDANGDQNRFKLTDIKYEVMKQILRFIYTEKVEGLTELAKELIVAAHRFKLEDLKTMCGKSLFKILDVNNVIDIHVLAVKYDTKWLKDRTTDFIIDNVHRVIKTSTYKNLVDLHPHLLDELLCEMVYRKISPPIETPVPSL